MTDKFVCGVIGFLLAFFFVLFIWWAYETGYSSAIKLCSSHPAECLVIFGQGGNQ